MREPLPSLILFARVPVLGRVKTRLAPRLGDDGALALYRAFLEDASRVYGGETAWAPVVTVEPDPDDPRIAALFPAPWRREAQGSGGLGERLGAAFEREFARGTRSALALGSDHPALPRSSLVRLFAALADGAQAAAIPADDGGYCAIALSSTVPVDAAFGGIPWSTEDVLAATRERLGARGVPLQVVGGGYDVDRPEDLDRLRRDLAGRDSGSEDFPASTARVLAGMP
ncbi:MAG: TIGR04282 family arsenosugar biosynthesis glycosyltransferase [Acidobacteriota bacterium]